ncbi:MAG: 23S rRNA (uracil1939-C5)-methyltransferase [Chloroflexi bacterium]|nr:MAG: 23S rRNA (uracil1939-C5)-methyltransferase [Chloroflexota bacterium]
MNPTFDIDLTAYSFGGDAIGHLPDGKTIFVPFGIQGERVEVEVVNEKRNFSRGRIKKIITPAAIRIEPRCIHYKECGGCHYQHLSYADQLSLKQRIVLEQMQRIGKIENPPVKPIVPSTNEWNYRNTVQFHLSVNGKPGFQRIGAAGVIEIKECHLPIHAINELWPSLEMDPAAGINRVSIRCGSDDELLVGLESEVSKAPDFEADFRVSVVFLGVEGDILLSGEDYSVMQVNNRNFKVSAASFFQVNLPQAEAMVDHVLANIKVTEYSTVVDAYCGVGLFSAFLAPKVKNLVGIEFSEDASRDYSVNLDEFENVSLYIGAVEEVFPLLEVKPEVVLLDPPRAGMEPGAMAGVISFAPKQIIYISCDPSTLARDAQKLTTSGYSLISITPFDLFPQTYHIETISVFEK